ncbi:MAG: Proline--tRNA ligase [candidate division WS2 bacterium]|nr:Proline--tRNA ligase [Candidatus Lithacetigena glycinireducens]
MRATRLFTYTLREDPAEAEVDSHKLLLRAGFIRQFAAGVFAYLPLGLRSLKKIENIIREEHSFIGAQETQLSILQTRELWEEAGRWNVYGDILFRLKDRKDRDLCLGPTHEEPITDIVRNMVRSYRELPVALYQIQTKFRDEARPRFGLIRCREFLMKDMYSFHETKEDLEKFYEQVTRCYERIFSRLNLTYFKVEADPGAIGGSANHEFVVPGLSGESQVFLCSNCNYKATSEKADGKISEIPLENVETSIREVYTPQANSIEKLSTFLMIKPSNIIKTMVFIADNKPIVVLIRGDYEVNEAKLINNLNISELRVATGEEVNQHFSSPIGFLGPKNLPAKTTILADESVFTLKSGVVGANKEDYHLLGFNPYNDLKSLITKGNYRTTKNGDLCPLCEAPLKEIKGMEVGHVFNLGTKYSDAMKATFTNREGKEQTFLMGCYGIGVSRSLQSVAEEHHDENGLKWPVSVAPYELVIIPIDYQKTDQKNAANQLYEKLLSHNFEVVLDDRETTAGVKFKDADLIGYPLRITISPRTLAKGSVEVKLRKGGSSELISQEEVVNYLLSLRTRLFKEIEETVPPLLTVE